MFKLFVKENIIVTTDDEKIIRYCKSNKINYIKRIKSLSLGKITSMQILYDVIHKKKLTLKTLYIYR